MVKGKEFTEEPQNFKKLYLSCLVDDFFKIAFISSVEGGMDIGKVAQTIQRKL